MIKKYKADTQEEAIEMARKDLGDSAIVLSIKKITPKGIVSTFKKPYVELTATNTTDNINQENTERVNFKDKKSKYTLDKLFKLLEYKPSEVKLDDKELSLKDELKSKDEQIKLLQQKLQEVENNFKNTMLSLNETKSTSNSKYENNLVEFFYDLLKSQDVCEAVCEDILTDIDKLSKEQDLNIDFIVKIIYNKILSILENVKATTINLEKTKEAKKIVFLGPTGVGKTTTIAKISSNIMMKEGLRVSFITLDTYRIAAVEQLKTYAEILNSDVEVIYDLYEVDEKVEPLSVVNDLIFFDTAGRSHNNKENMEEIRQFIEKIPDADKYLVLSSTIKLEDMINIINAYSVFTNFKLIFTKLDETNSLGNILNIAKMTDKKIAYLTSGQNVPSDINEFSPVKISKALLGSIYK